MSQTSDSCLDTWMGREALAEAMIPVIGRLYRENNVVTSIHGRSLINKSTMNILKAHRFARRMSKDRAAPGGNGTAAEHARRAWSWARQRSTSPA